MALAPEASPLLSQTLVFDTPTSVVQPTSSDIQALLEVGYTEAEIPIQQPATESIRVTTTAVSPAASGQDVSTDRSSLHLSDDSDDDDGSVSRFSVQARDAAAPSEPPAE